MPNPLWSQIIIREGDMIGSKHISMMLENLSIGISLSTWTSFKILSSTSLCNSEVKSRFRKKSK